MRANVLILRKCGHKLNMQSDRIRMSEPSRKAISPGLHQIMYVCPSPMSCISSPSCRETVWMIETWPLRRGWIRLISKFSVMADLQVLSAKPFPTLSLVNLVFDFSFGFGFVFGGGLWTSGSCRQSVWFNSRLVGP
jgi:hypothetical protein